MEEAEKIIGSWLGLAADEEKRNAPAKGEKNRGQKRLNLIKAPAQGGEAGDGSTPSVVSERKSSPQVPMNAN
jgi:hypothetical protein